MAVTTDSIAAGATAARWTELGVLPTPQDELDRQVRTLVRLGYPALAGVDEDGFRALVEPLRSHLPGPEPEDPAAPEDTLPFLLVVRAGLVGTVAAVERWDVRGKAGWTDMHDELASYLPLPDLTVPDAPAYLLLGVRTGIDSLGVAPADALPGILAARRTPLTIDEAVALTTHVPDVLHRRHAFQALGSRNHTRRVPSVWTSKGAPRLGWCWEGNPHTWLGAASAATRRG